MKGSLIIIGFFALGVLLGYSELFSLDLKSVPMTKYVLYLLMFSVGISLGSDKNIWKQLKGLNWRMWLLPLMTAIGTFTGCFVAWTILNGYSIPEYISVGSGFAYYSLSSIFLSELKGIELGTIALLSNVMREIIALIFIPSIGKTFGPLSAISVGGATTFDTTLPIITQTVGKKYVVVSIFHGCILDFSVPFLVTFFGSI